jgi:hypothetical protein
MTDNISGILATWEVDEVTPFTTVLEVLRRTVPKQHLRVLLPSSKLPYERRDHLQPLIERGVAFDLLLLEPRAENSLYSAYHQDAAQNPLSMTSVMQIIANLNKTAVTTPSFAVKFFSHYTPESLIFVDDSRLFFCSSIPYISTNRTIYEVEPGARSLYRLYDDAFHFIWRNALSLVNV